MEELKKNSSIAVHPVKVLSTPTEAQLSKMFETLKKEHPGAKTFYCTNGAWGVALGEYVGKHHLDFDVITTDLRADVAALIKKGRIKAAISQRPFTWVTMALEILTDVFNNKPVVKYTDTGTYEVNKSNISIYEKRI